MNDGIAAIGARHARAGIPSVGLIDRDCAAFPSASGSVLQPPSTRPPSNAAVSFLAARLETELRGRIGSSGR